jgi:response regulator RpfG family c-di-GMP phosphodiesterase
MSIDKELPKILIVDDSEENRIILQELCKSLGYSSEVLMDGRSALNILETFLPLAILLDIKMEDMDGFQVLEAIKKNQKWKDIPVIMITSLDDSESILKCLKLGADDYIPKPFEPAIVKARLERSISNLNALKKEKLVLEKTFSGSIKILSDIISSLSPVLFGKCSKVRRIARLIAEEMNYPEIWEIDVASIFSMVGCISFSHEMLEKIINNKPLTIDEKKLYENHTNLGYKLLNNIPRLENVSLIVLFQNKNNLSEFPESLQLNLSEIPLGSKILKAAFEYEIATLKTNNMNEIKSKMKLKQNLIDPKVYSALENVLNKDSNREIKEISVNQLIIGMTFTEDVFTVSGIRIINKLQEATESVIERIKAVHSKLPIAEPLKMFSNKL